MNSKDAFKTFVQKNPILIKHVNNGSMTWQKFYEMYDMYGEDSEVWNDYLKTSVSSSSGFFDFVKNMDIDSIQSGVNSVQRVLSLLQDMSSNNSSNTNKEEFKPRPIYKHFED